MQSYLHFQMITWAGVEKGLERVRGSGDELGAVVSEGVQNKPLWHENYFELKAFGNRRFSELPYLPKSKTSQKNSIVLDPLPRSNQEKMICIT